MGKKVAVIGAGPSGLVALKTLQDTGHNVVCFERLPEIGGLWNYDLHTNQQGETQGYVDLPRDKDQPIHSSYNSLQFLTLSYANLFSDFVPKEMDLNAVSKYMSPSEYLQYLKKYAKYHNLSKYINFNSHVVKLEKPRDKFAGWVVTYESNNSLHEEWFDFVFVATSDNVFPEIPDILNINKFKGLAIHSSQVRKEEVLFPGRKVLVIGGKFSGSDMVVNALRHNAEKIYWSLCRNQEKNQWCIDRLVSSSSKPQKKLPWLAFLTRYENQINGIPAMSMVQNTFVLIKQKDELDKPKVGDPFFVNDSAFLTQAIQNKQITHVPTVLSVSENGDLIKFIDESSLPDIDLIIFATGFKRRVPFLENILSAEQQCSALYRCSICPKRELDGIAHIGFVLGPYAITVVAELQCKWLCNTMLKKNYSEDGSLYSQSERTSMEIDIVKHFGDESKDFMNHHLIKEPFEYLDNLFSEIGYKVPSFDDLLKTKEIELAVALYFGPLTGAQYTVFDSKDEKFVQAKSYLINIAKATLQEDFQHLVEKYA